MSNKTGTESSAISLPKGGGALKGMGETFSPDLHTGTGNFSVPISLPPGRNGFQPELTLSYSTGSGNGPFGLGWSVGVPGVSRKTSKGVPRYDAAQDVFILSGAEDLVPVPGGLGGATRYRPRTEGLFARIERHHDAGNDYWEVQTKDGLVSRYGTPGMAGNDPAVVADPSDRSKVFAWNLTQTQDPFGNLIVYEYERDSGSEGPHHWDQVYLKGIRYADYTENDETRFLISVNFLYEDRPDPFSDHRAGFEIRARQRCRQIDVRTHADTERLVRACQFEYLDEREGSETSLPLNGVSLLSRVLVTGHDGDRAEDMPPLEFSYTPFEPAGQDFFPIDGNDLPAVALSNPNLELADLFGNGLPDILETNGTVRYWRNLGNGAFDLPREMPEAPTGFHLADSGVQLIDADGDGGIDLLVSAGATSGYYPLRFGGMWDRRAFQRYQHAPSFDLEDPAVRLVDLDGDGVTDAVRSGSRFECFFNHPQQGWSGARQVERRAVEDFPNVTFADPRVRFADLNGDGLQDIVIVHDGAIEYWPALGHGDWASRVTMQNSPRFPYGYNPQRILVGDVDGDGLADLVYVDDTRVTLWINQSGNRWSDPIEFQGTPPVSDMDAVRLTDLLGTGVSGVLWSAEANGRTRERMFFLDFTGGTKPYLLNEMDNHLGAITRVEYVPSTRFYVADEQRPETRWRTPLPFPVQVVARVEVIDALSGGKLTTEYTYHHGYWDGGDREFRGFGRVDQRDTEVFEQFNAPGLYPGRSFDPVPTELFSPPTETRAWFHQGPIGDEFGGWEEPDYRGEYWPDDPQALERPSAMTDFLNNLPRRDKRDALRALRSSALRTELYALDGSARQNRPYTVTESLHGVREEAPPVPGEDGRRRIFFPHLLAQRTTQWERGDDPMTQFTFTDGYDRHGQPGSQSSVAVPRGRDYRVAAPAGEPYLATHTVTDYAEPVHDLVLKDMTDLVFDGKILRSTAPTGWGNSGASSMNRLEAGEDGWVEASTPTPGLGVILGLSTVSADDHYGSVDYGVYFSHHTSIIVLENGVFRDGTGNLTEADVLRVERIGATIQYKRNGEVFYTSEIPSTTELIADLGFYHQDAQLTNLRCSKPARSQHVVNGASFVEVEGLEFEGDVIRKSAENGWGNGGAVSLDYFAPGEDGWVEARTTTPGLRSFLGLSAVSPDHHYQSIQFSVYFYFDTVYVFENGAAKKQAFIGLSPSDVMRIERQGTTVRYRHNGQVVYISEVPSDAELRVDLSLYDQGAEIKGLAFSKKAGAAPIQDRVARTTTYEIVNDGAPSVLALQAGALDGSAARQIIGQELKFYDGPAFQGLPFGQVGAHGALSRVENLTLTEEILREAYKSGSAVQDPPELPLYLAPEGAAQWTSEYPQEFRDLLPPLAGYVYQPGGAGSPFAQGYFVAAEGHRYDCVDGNNRGLLTVTRDPLGRDTTIGYDGYDLLPVAVTYPAGLTTSAVHDYRALQPREVTDPNGNRTAVTYTPLGLVETTAVMGKVGEDTGDTPEEPGARRTYDFTAFSLRGQPISVRTTQRVHHVQDTSVPPAERDETIEMVEYSDGFGRLLQTRAQREDVTFGDPVFGDAGLSADPSQPGTDAVGQQSAPGDPPNVVVSGWQVYDNKGRVAQEYEPFFSTGWDYAPPLETQRGQKVTMSYDPRGQVILTLQPDGSEERVVYGVPSGHPDPAPEVHMVNGVCFEEVAGLEFQGDIVRKSSIIAWNNSGAVSVGYLAPGEDGWVEASTSTPGLRAFFGLSAVSPDHHYTAIDYAVYFDNSKAILVHEKGEYRRGVVDLTDSDVVRIERVGATVQYKRNGEVFYTSEIPSDTRLHVDLSYYDQGAEIKGLTFSAPEPFAPTPWEVYSYDENDNAQRTHGAGDPTHWDTPASVVVDALGRTVEAVQRNGPDPSVDWRVSRSTYDLRDNQLTVTDALGRVALRSVYDLADNQLRSESVDAGVQRTVVDAAGQGIELRDSKGALVLQGYDLLDRPVRLWARDGENQALTLRECLVYGDAPDSGLTPDQARDANLLGALYQHYDEAGLLVAEGHDFKGNPLEQVRQVVSDAAILTVFDPPPADWQVSPFRVDWQPPAGTTLEDHAGGLLDATPYRTSVAYDALNRPKFVSCPQDVEGERKALRPEYNRAGALERVELVGTPHMVNGVSFVETDGLEFSGDVIRKTAGNGWTNGGVSVNYLASGEDGWVEAATSTPGLRAFFGLSAVSTDHHYQSIDYSVYFHLDRIYVYEQGTSKALAHSSVGAGDVMRIERQGTTIRYLHNGQVVYTSAAPSDTELRVDLSFYDQGAEVQGLTFSKKPVYGPMVERIGYNARGQRTLIAYANGVMTRYSYDPQTFRLARMRTERYETPQGAPLTYRPAAPGQPLQDCAYAYDLTGNILEITDRAPGSGILNNPDAAVTSDPVLASLLAAGDALVRRFSYDPLYRLGSASGRESDTPRPTPSWNDIPRGVDATRAQGYTEEYQYDALGNLLELKHRGSGNDFTRLFAPAPGSNRLANMTVGGTVYDYAYDASGNLVRETTSRHFEWDHSDRMKTFRTQTGNAEPSVYAHYLYDSAGQRVKKLARKQGGRVEVTVYVGGIFERHRIAQGATVQENNTLHVMDDQSRIALVRVGEPFPGDSAPPVRFHLGDHLGNSNLVVGRDGSFINREEYTPYGETSFGSFARKRYRFTGKEKDEETGLYYHGARYYAPWLGRWVSADPAGMVDGANLYQYVRSNPMLLTDPTGMEGENQSDNDPSHLKVSQQEQATPDAGRRLELYRAHMQDPTRKSIASGGSLPITDLELQDYFTKDERNQIDAVGKVISKYEFVEGRAISFADRAKIFKQYVAKGGDKKVGLMFFFSDTEFGHIWNAAKAAQQARWQKQAWVAQVRRQIAQGQWLYGAGPGVFVGGGVFLGNRIAGVDHDTAVARGGVANSVTSMGIGARGMRPGGAPSSLKGHRPMPGTHLSHSRHWPRGVRGPRPSISGRPPVRKPASAPDGGTIVRVPAPPGYPKGSQRWTIVYKDGRAPVPVTFGGTSK